MPETPIATEASANEAAALLEAIVKHMGIEATVTGTVGEEDTINLRVSSPDSALLIGRKGRNLSSLQYLLNRMFLTGDNAEAAERVVIDIEGYQDRRRESLEEMARHLAQKAKDTGRDMRVKPLNPQERRIIHLALQDDPEIRTFSLGNSLHRTVVISAKAATPQPGGDRPRRSRSGGGNRRGGRGPRRDRPDQPNQTERTDRADQSDQPDQPERQEESS